MPAYEKADLERRMAGAVESLKSDLQGLRTGRASINLLDPVNVEVYGANMPLNQVATVSVPEPRMITVSIWDKSVVAAVDKAIRSSGLGLNPVVEGTNLRIPIPPLTEERRKDLAKIAAKYTEQQKVAVRNIRRDANDDLKKAEKDGVINQDEQKRMEGEVQKLTDEAIKRVDEALKNKEQEIMHV